MAKNTVTLKQIAEEAGVSTTTVHRVLNDKEGCGEELKARILRIADEMGYCVNYSASSLRRKTSYIALVFPSENFASRFFMGNILAGYRRCQEELPPCNVQFLDYYYDYDDPDSMCPILQRICRDDPVRVDGVVLWGNTGSVKITALLNRLRGKNVPLVMLERAPWEEDLYTCCVGPDDHLVGAMAGELLAKLTHRSGKALILAQELGFPDPIAISCAEEVRAQGGEDLEPLIIPLSMQNRILTDAVAAVLEENPDIVAVYSACARHTLAYLQASKRLGLRMDAAVGSELFSESSEALENGSLSAVINKCPQTIGRQALQLLFAQVVKNEPMPREHLVTPMVVLRSGRHAFRNR